ncbi:hypothetical protein ACFX2J_031587 [Malus domestica]
MCYCNGIWGKGGGTKFNKMKLKMAVARIKLLWNKRRAVVKQMRPNIALLLQSENITFWLPMSSLSELVESRPSIITKQRECPPYLKEGIASLIVASPRCSEISELIALRDIFEKKYSKDFVYADVDVRPSCCVNRMLLDKHLLNFEGGARFIDLGEWQ